LERDGASPHKTQKAVPPGASGGTGSQITKGYSKPSSTFTATETKGSASARG